MSLFFNRRWRPAIFAFFVAMFCIVHAGSVYGQPLFSPGTPIFTFTGMKSHAGEAVARLNH